MLNPLPIILLGSLLLGALLVSTWLWIGFALAVIFVAAVNA